MTVKPNRHAPPRKKRKDWVRERMYREAQQILRDLGEPTGMPLLLEELLKGRKKEE